MNINRYRALLLAALLSTTPAIADEGDKVIRLSEPVEVTASAEVFGRRLTLDGEPMSLSELVADADSHADQPVLVRTRVSKVCQKKGCFFIAQDGNTVVRVSFRDYGFFVPTDSGGKEVTLEGSLVRVELSEEKAEHYREDANGAAIEAGVTWEIVADAVSVPKA